VAATTVLAAAVCPPGTPHAGWVAIADGIIQEVGDGRAPSGALDLGDLVVAPGYIDLQVNGIGEIDFATAPPEQWSQAAAQLARAGTTAWCATFISTELAAYDGLLTRANAATSLPLSSTILGVHLEGPFLGGAPGAHRREVLTTADPAWTGALLDQHPNLVRMVTLAPEADPDLATTRALNDREVVVALGHSSASYDDAIAAADAGATVVTHLFNGMGSLHHRDPGLAGAALDDERLTPTVIADLVHVHPVALRLALARKKNVALVSDAVAIGALVEADGAAWTTDGVLAGATTGLDGAVGNLVAIGVPIARALEMATAIPAAVLGLSDRGRLVPGAVADIVAVDPMTARVQQVWVGGDSVATSDPA